MKRRHLLSMVILALVVALCGANANWEDLVYESGFTLIHGDGSGGEWGRRKRWKRLPGKEAIDEVFTLATLWDDTDVRTFYASELCIEDAALHPAVLHIGFIAEDDWDDEDVQYFEPGFPISVRAKSSRSHSMGPLEAVYGTFASVNWRTQWVKRKEAVSESPSTAK